MTQGAVNRVGAVLDDKWSLTELIGEGGMAAVYGARHVRNGGIVAIKILGKAAASDSALATRFLTEGYVANHVRHRGAVRVIDDGRTPEGAPYIVMERLNGSTLDALASGRGLPVDDVLRYGIAIAEVLATAHNAGIVHRDVKPENVFLCDDGTIKLLDFGIAQLKGFTQQARITIDGMTLGTPAFMPPEQVMGQWDRVGPASDVYAAGGTLFNLVTGEFAHRAETAQEFMVRTATEPARPVRSVRPAVPVRFAEVIDRALAQMPEDRYENATALLEALRSVSIDGRFETARSPAALAPAARGSFSSGQGPAVDARSPVRHTTAPVSSASRTRSRKPWMTPLLVGAVAVLGIGVGTASYVASFKASSPAAQSPSAPFVATQETLAPTPTIQAVVNVDPPSASIARVPSATGAPPPEVTPASASPAGGPKPPPPHEVATARPKPTSTPAPQGPHGAPDPADPLGFH